MILGLDLGSRTLGIAICDSLCILARPLTTIYTKKDNDLDFFINELKSIIKENNIKKIVIGYPFHINSDYSNRCKITDLFVYKLKKEFKINDIIKEDERRTTLYAKNLMIDANSKKGSIKKKKDEVAATIILQKYLDKIK